MSTEGCRGADPVGESHASARPSQADEESLYQAAHAATDHRPDCVYVYGNENGPVAMVARYAPGTLDARRKSFRAFRYEHGVWSLGGVGKHLPLYRLCDVLAAGKAAEQVFVVEGEKCVDALWAVGLPAVTNPFGAGKWTAAHTASLRGLHVAICADNDPPGRKHAETVADSLIGIAASVRMVPVPGVDERPAADGWDVADWLAAGGTAELLSEIARSAPTWSGSSTPGDWPEAIPLGEADEPLPFPLHEALPPVLAEFAVAAAEVVKIDVTVPAVLMPAILSVAVGNAFCVQVSPAYTEPNLSRYALWSKPSGERGSELFRHVVHPLDEWMNQQKAEYERALKEALRAIAFFTKRAEGIERRAGSDKTPEKVRQLRQEAAEAREQIPKLPRRPLLYLGDCTSEAHARGLAEQGGSMGMISADARQAADALLGRYRGDGKTDDSVYLRAHGGDVIDRGRVGNAAGGEYLRVPRPQIGMALGLQPDKLEELGRRPELLSSGFLARCNIFSARSLVGTRVETGDERPVPEAIRDAWDRCAQGLVEHRQKLLDAAGDNEWSAVVLTLDPEAMELRRLFANEIERRQGPDGDLRGTTSFASKCAGEAARLAALFHLAELSLQGELDQASASPISAATWRLAEAHQRWQLAETLRVLSLAQEGHRVRLARRVLKWAAREPVKRREVSLRDLVTARIPKDSPEAAEVMSLLIELGWARQTRTAKPPPTGRERFEWNPLVLGGGL